MKAGDCVFCRISRKEEPASIIYEDEQVIAFADAFPATRGHLLVAPKQHYETIYELPEELGAALFRVTVRLARRVKRILQPDGLNLLQANEPAGQQDVFHFHLHIIPRYWSDGVQLRWPAGSASRSDLDELARLLRER